MNDIINDAGKLNIYWSFLPLPPLKYRIAKRVFDVSISLSLAVLFLPVFAVISLLILFESGGPIFNRNKKFGKKARIIKVYEFNCLRKSLDKTHIRIHSMPGYKSGIPVRCLSYTNTGSFIERTSLKFLPMLLNVIKGDMSFVGPLPFDASDGIYDRKWCYLRLGVRPGMICLSKVAGNIDDMTQICCLDLKYIREQSLCLDFSILINSLILKAAKVMRYSIPWRRHILEPGIPQDRLWTL